MSDMIETQSIIYESIVKLGINLKKDSADRKTVDYFKRKLNTLEQYWNDYQVNHERIEMEVTKTDPYFTNREYEKTSKAYESTKALIHQQYQLRFMKAGSLTTEEQTVREKSSSPTSIREEAETCDEAGPSVPKQLKDRPLPKPNKDSNNKLDELLKKQYANFKAFVRTTATINVDSISDKWEFEDVLKSLQARWSAIDKLHWEIEIELDEENEVYNNMYDKYEIKFNNLKKALNTKMWSVAHRERSTPQIEIPNFNGNYNQWVSFRDLFTEVIHNNPSLSNGQKMQYLKGKVRGEAEKLIQHLQISTDNYMGCWNILTHRYDNKKLIFSSHMNILLGLPNIQQQSLQQIKRMHDTTLECLNAIKNLGVDITTWDPLIVHILGQKLDTETYTDYIESLKNSKELPILEDFLGFLETKFTSLETVRRKQDVVPSKIHQNNNQNQLSNIRKNNYNTSFSQTKINQTNGNRTFAKSMHVSNIKCPLCSNQHGIYNCKTFLKLSDEQRLKTANKLKLCTNCLFSHFGNPCISNLTCRKCPDQHNTLLHDAFTKLANTSTPSSSGGHVEKQNIKRNESLKGNVNASQDEKSEILLATALVKVKGVDGMYQTLRALIDQGSQISLITERAAQMLGIQRQRCKGVIFGVGQKENSCKGVINLECASTYNDFQFESEVFIMNELIKSLPNQTFTRPSWSYIENINLADPEFFKSRPVDLLFGADIYANIMLSGIIKGEHDEQPMAQQTQLGWLLCGKVKTYQCNVVLNNVEEIQKFWEVEEINETTDLSVEDQMCVEFYTKTTTRNSQGRYEVRIPLKEDLKHKLGSSKPMAIAQLKHLERRLEKQPALAEKYKNFMNEYAALNHMTPEHYNSNIKLECFLPHHGVQREESSTTKLRVVFNASAKTSTKYSLNDVMLKGPNLQKDLQALLLQWRQYPYAFTADIEKMYRQILVNSMDQHLQKIVWRESSRQPIQVYQLNTVTYGTKAAPFLAIMTLKQLAADERSKFPKAAAVVENCFYMDDLLHGCYNLEQGKQSITDLIQLLNSGGFNLRKWSSNNPELLERIHTSQEESIYNFKNDEMLKTLGLCWNTKGDRFTFRCNFSPSTSKLTKRNLLSEISKLYDPLGWLTPLSTKLKLLFQRLWQNNLQWDDKVTDEIHNDWVKLIAEINNIEQCEIPRWILSHENDVIELHGYCDASIEAYACVVYARTKQQQKTVIVAAKSKLIPRKKTLTLPRIELCGAYLLSKLVDKIKQSISCQTEVYGWCDSMVVLGWLQGDPARWKPFVANRVNAIKQIMPTACWRYVKSGENPADCASRGLTAPQLLQHPLWWNGPAWLASYNTRTDGKQPIYHTEEETKKIKLVNIIQNTNSNNIIDNLLLQHNSFIRITRVLAWILRALTPIVERKHLPKYLTLRELRKAKSAIIKQVQSTSFTSEMDTINKHGEVPTNSKLLNLKPFIDNKGFLRVGGRLRNANISDGMKHPKIIPNNSRLAELLIEEAHQLTFHGGPRLTLTMLRQQYWITSGYRTTKKQLRNCVTCRKQEAKKQYQLMGDLPAARSNPAPPFYHTGVDYTGFVHIKANKGRGVRTLKGYVAVFICMVTKAVHLELVSDLTSSAFLAALKRMAARRGTPHHLYSDQGTNFIGANRILQEEYDQIQASFGDSFQAEIATMNIQWHFNAPSWPSAGGLWERAVRSLKFHLKRVVGEQRLTFEEFTTVLTQLEACLNSRPLCSLTENIEDLDYLSPAHFLTGRADLTVIETKEDARTRWHLTTNIFKQIWSKWKIEYLGQLTAREKWCKPQTNLKIGNIVVVHEDNIPAGRWVMGRVVDLHPGNDGYVRVVSLKTKNGIIKRPVVKLSLLPVETGETTKQEGSTEPNSTAEPDTRTRSNNKPTRKTTLPNLPYIVMALTFFMSLCSVTTGSYNITTLNHNQSFYFDPISKISLVKDSWVLVVFYNMSPYWEGIQAFDKVTTFLNKTCKTTGSEQCNIILPQLIHESKELKYYNELLMTQHVSGHSRQRRGLINGVGYLANSLFGVLDEQFAEKYSRDINLIRQNEKHLAGLWKNQTSIVESEYNLLKRTEEIMAKQHKIINKHLNTLDNISNKIQKQINNISVLQELTMTALTASNLLHNLKRTQDVLLDILTNIHHGQFNIHLLTPEQLQKELSIISGHLSDDKTLPIELHDIRKLYSLLTIKTRITEEYFLFQITFPLISRDRYKLYKILPIPHQYNNTMVEFIPSSEYIATDLKRDSYLTITAEELTQCKQEDDKFICDWKKPIYHLESENNFCDINRDTNKCKVQRSRCENNWIPLTNPSLFLYHICNICTVKLICGEQITIVQLSKAGVIYLEPGCLLKGQDFTLTIHSNRKNKLDTSTDIFIPEMDQLNYIINSTMPFENFINTTDTSEIKYALQTLHKRIEHMKTSQVEVEETLSYHDIHQYAVSYILVGALALAAGVLLYRRKRLRAHRARITSDMELQPTTSVRDVQVNNSASARQNIIERQCSATHIYGELNQVMVNRACPRIPRDPIGTPNP